MSDAPRDGPARPARTRRGVVVLAAAGVVVLVAAGLTWARSSGGHTNRRPVVSRRVVGGAPVTVRAPDPGRLNPCAVVSLADVSSLVPGIQNSSLSDGSLPLGLTCTFFGHSDNSIDVMVRTDRFTSTLAFETLVTATSSSYVHVQGVADDAMILTGSGCAPCRDEEPSATISRCASWSGSAVRVSSRRSRSWPSRAATLPSSAR
jgi:hypothetical protein